MAVDLCIEGNISNQEDTHLFELRFKKLWVLRHLWGYFAVYDIKVMPVNFRSIKRSNIFIYTGKLLLVDLLSFGMK